MVAQAGAFYYLPAVNLADLLQPAFLNAFVRQGRFCWLLQKL
jgi:hypothetical protein